MTAKIPAELAPHPRTDLAALAVRREVVFARHQKRIIEDPHLDPRLREKFLNRTSLNTAATAERAGLSEQRISLLRTSRRKPSRVRPHPAILPETSTIEAVLPGWNIEDPGVEQGILDRWRIQTRRAKWDSRKGEIVPSKAALHGRGHSAE